VLTQRQPRVDLALDGGEPQLLDPARIRGDEREVGQVGQRLVTPPQLQGPAEVLPRRERVARSQQRMAGTDQPLERDRVDRVVIGDQLVPAVDGGEDLPSTADPVGLERLAQVMHVGVDSADVTCRHPFAPQLVGEPRHRQHRRSVNDKRCQHGTLLPAAQRHRVRAPRDAQRSQR
jgi:hypothetical protein